MKKKKGFKEVTFYFDEKEYKYLELLCKKEKISLDEFISNSLLKSMLDYEDRVLAERADEIIKNSKPEDYISWEELKSQLFPSLKE